MERNRRIALCISGQPRQVGQAFNESIKQHIIEPNNITDVFCHTWWREEWDDNVPHQTHNRPKYYFSKQDLVDIRSMYKPTRIEIEDDRKYHNYVRENFMDNPEYQSAQEHNIIDTYPKYLSIRKANDLKNEYEREHGFQYDYVIKLRMDLFFASPIQIEKLNVSDKIYIPSVAPGTPMGLVQETHANDMFAVGNKENMDTYCALADNLHVVAKNHPETAAEGTLGNWLVDNEVKMFVLWPYGSQVIMTRDRSKLRFI